MPELKAKRLIAIIDDEAALCEATESLLRAAGYDAECYESAEDFLRSRCDTRADCIVLDVHLPGMSGLALQRYLGERHSRVSIVFMTAQVDPKGRTRAAALEAGAVAFLRKPFGIEDLLDCVRLGTNTKVQYRAPA